jgi:hypothetical protein
MERVLDNQNISLRRNVLRLVGSLVCLGAASVGSAAPPGPSLNPRDHGFMLYLNKPIGGGVGADSHAKFGFRIEQVRMGGNNGAPDAPDPMQRRALIGWQMGGGQESGMHLSNMRMELGGRVTYDLSHRSFSLVSSSGRSRAPAVAIGPQTLLHARGVTAKNSLDLSFADSKPFDSRGADFAHERIGGFSMGESHQQPSMLHEAAAAALLTFKSRISSGSLRPSESAAMTHRPQALLH